LIFWIIWISFRWIIRKKQKNIINRMIIILLYTRIKLIFKLILIINRIMLVILLLRKRIIRIYLNKKRKMKRIKLLNRVLIQWIIKVIRKENRKYLEIEWNKRNRLYWEIKINNIRFMIIQVRCMIRSHMTLWVYQDNLMMIKNK